MADKIQKNKSSTQKFTEIEDIVEDVVFFSSGNACLIIEIQAANFALLSREEQNGKIYAYASLLNSLPFPIQILIKNKRVSIASYVKLLNEELEKAQDERTKSYRTLYKDFVENLVSVNTVLDKKFYIVLPYTSLEKGVGGAFGRGDFRSVAKTGLHTKATSLNEQLGRLGLRSKILKREELVSLFYSFYNDDYQEVHIETDEKPSIITTGRSGGNT